MIEISRSEFEQRILDGQDLSSYGIRLQHPDKKNFPVPGLYRADQAFQMLNQAIGFSFPAPDKPEPETIELPEPTEKEKAAMTGADDDSTEATDDSTEKSERLDKPAKKPPVKANGTTTADSQPAKPESGRPVVHPTERGGADSTATGTTKADGQQK